MNRENIKIKLRKAVVLLFAVSNSLFLLASCMSNGSSPLVVGKPVANVTPFSQWAWSKTSSRSNEGDKGAWLGIFNEAAPNDMSSVSKLEDELGGKKFAVVMWFNDFSKGFPTAEAENVWKSGALPDITWEPWLWNDKNKIHLADINDGSYDQYIFNWGKEAAEFGKPVMVRWGHEFNGNWYPWAIAENGNSPSAYIKAYQRVHDLVEKAGAKNVIWVWCPNNNSVPAEAWNNPILAYPGDQYVDMVGLDGYDFDGTSSFSDLFSSIYSKILTSIKKPMFIAEMATGRKGAEKAKWIQDMDKSLRGNLAGIKGFVWFNINKERDWRFDQSVASTQAAREAFSTPFYHSNPESVLKLNQVFLSDYSSLKSQIAKVSETHSNKEYTAPMAANSGNAQITWTNVPSITVQDSNHGIEGTIQVMWSVNKVYIHADIKDAYPLTNSQKDGNIWNGDCLEFLISTDPKADPNRQYYTPTDWQLGFAPTQTSEIKTWEWSKLKSAVPGAEGKAVKTDSGYQIDVSFPWTSLGNFTPAGNEKLGFDLAIDNAGASGTRNAQWIWSGGTNFYVDPSQWGTLVLKK